MDTARVESSVVEGVLTLTLSSSDGMNILGVETRRSIHELLKKHASDKDVRCVILRSRGKAFSAGADLNHLLTLRSNGAKDYSRFVRSFLRYVEGFPKPTIGLVEGPAVGGGLELLMTLDIVLASPMARFGQTELNVGLIPGGGGSQRLPRLVGVRKAKEMIYTGDLISAEQALDLGLVNRVVESGMLEVEAGRIIARIRSKSERNLRLVKKLINAANSAGLPAGLELERRLYAEVLAGKDAKRGIRKFLEKRVPSQ